MIQTIPTLTKQMTLKKQLRFYLNQKDITASQLAKRSSVPKQSMSDWLSGSNPRNITQVKKVADALGVTIDHLMFGEGEGKTSDKSLDIETILNDQWISGLFEIKFRRVKK